MTSFSSVPAQVTVNSVGNVLTLTGVGTSWSGSPFSLPSPGVSGCSITAQNVISNTSATITLSAGPQIGILTISDGTNLYQLSVAPVNSIIINQDNYHRANSSLGGVGNGTTDVLNAYEVSSNQLRTTNLTGGTFTGRLYYPTQIADSTQRFHFGPGTNTTNGAVMLLARSQGLTSTSQAVGFYAFPGLALFNNSQLFQIPAGSTATPRTNLQTFSSGVCPIEGWLELIMTGNSMTGNVYAADGTTLIGSITYTGLTGTYLNAGYGGIVSFNFNNFWSEYDSWETIDIQAQPPFMPLNTTTVFAVVGQATNFSGSPFTVTGVSGCSIFSQAVTDATHATVTIVSGGTAGSLILTDTGSNTTFTILVTAQPQIEITPVTYVGNGTVTIAITGINIALSGTPFSVTGTPSASVTGTTILNANNAVITVAVGSYAGILTITDTVSGASATFQVYHPSKGALKILYIGDSITFGTNGNPVGVMGLNLSVLGYNVTQVNEGVSGTTSANWALSTGGANMAAAVAAGVAAGCTWVQIMLGTNDGKTAINTSPANYLANITVVVKACLAAGMKVVLNQPPWSYPSAALGQWLPGVNTNYQEYFAALQPLVDSVNVFAGDTLALDWFELNPTHLQDGVHPTFGGNSELGQIWAYSFLKAILAAIVPPVVNASSDEALNRAQMRDVIRHKLNKRTALDEDPVAGKVGDPASTHLWPPNTLINDNLREAISEVNIEAKFSEVTGINITVPIVSATPQDFNLRTAGITQGLSLGQINEVRRVYMTDTSGVIRRLKPVARDEMDRRNVPFDTWSASTPERFSMDGYNLSLYPGSSAGGTLTIIAGTGIVGFVTDTDTIEQLPNDFHTVIMNVATGLIAATQVEDIEMVGAAKLYTGLGLAGIVKVKAWNARKNVEQQRTMELKTGAARYYGRR